MPAPLNLVILGKQGSGKGTQCDRLAEVYGLPHVSTGDMLRAAVKAGTDLGAEVAGVLQAGALVSDDLVVRLVEERLAQPDAAPGVLLDGFPRTEAQAKALDGLLEPAGVSLCVNLDVPLELVIARLSSRRVCEGCGTIYRDTDPSATSGVCANCGRRVVQRSDDTPEAIRTRLESYERDTAPLLDFYRERGTLVSVDGTKSPDEVTADIVAALRARGLA
ncbi:MAG TPA: adenylate kinase [Acidimicrobiales bacterium]|nr:adenylate kinase [Acidimicrobiales bacterium]